MTKEALAAALDAVEEGQGEKIMATLADMWIEEGIEKGIEQGAKALQDAILGTLEARFGMISSKLRSQITAVFDLNELRQLVEHAALAGSLAAFEAKIG